MFFTWKDWKFSTSAAAAWSPFPASVWIPRERVSILVGSTALGERRMVNAR
jgi:hypothetical protein